MPLFGAEYEVEIDKNNMAWEATQKDGSKVMISPHLCLSHHHQPEDDHRGWIDMTLLSMSSIGFYYPPAHLTLDLEQASIFIEGLTAVAQWAHLNKELEEGDGE